MNEQKVPMVIGKIKSAFRHRKNRKSRHSEANLDTKTTQILLRLM